ncbi:MAG: hypothetical protein ACOYX1_09520 [Acidobacteriota bacterium]
MAYLLSGKTATIVLRWLAMAVVLYLGFGYLARQATPAHPMTRTGMVVGWVALVFSLAAVYFLLARGWRSPLVWISAPVALVNSAAVLLHSDEAMVLTALFSVVAIAATSLKLGVKPGVLLTVAGSFLLGLAALLASLLLAAPLNGICSRYAPWVCNVTGLLWAGVAAALLCLAFSHSMRRLDQSAPHAG